MSQNSIYIYVLKAESYIRDISLRKRSHKSKPMPVDVLKVMNTDLTLFHLIARNSNLGWGAVEVWVQAAGVGWQT